MIYFYFYVDENDRHGGARTSTRPTPNFVSQGRTIQACIHEYMPNLFQLAAKDWFVL